MIASVLPAAVENSSSAQSALALATALLESYATMAGAADQPALRDETRTALTLGCTVLYRWLKTGGQPGLERAYRALTQCLSCFSVATVQEVCSFNQGVTSDEAAVKAALVLVQLVVCARFPMAPLLTLLETQLLRSSAAAVHTSDLLSHFHVIVGSGPALFLQQQHRAPGGADARLLLDLMDVAAKVASTVAANADTVAARAAAVITLYAAVYGDLNLASLVIPSATALLENATLPALPSVSHTITLLPAALGGLLTVPAFNGMAGPVLTALRTLHARVGGDSDVALTLQAAMAVVQQGPKY